MKIMIVSENTALKASIAKVLGLILEGSDDSIEVIQISHEDALVSFLEKEPDKVIICEYEEIGNKVGVGTYKDIKSSADEKTIVIRIGLSNYDYEDYLKAPFKLQELFKMLQI